MRSNDKGISKVKRNVLIRNNTNIDEVNHELQFIAAFVSSKVESRQKDKDELLII